MFKWMKQFLKTRNHKQINIQKRRVARKKKKKKKKQNIKIKR